MAPTDENSPLYFNLEFLKAALFRFWWLGILVVALCVAAAAAIAFLMKPIYRAEVLVTQADDNSSAGLSQLVGGLGNVAALAGFDLGGKSNVEVSLAMLSSYQLTESFIADNNLLPELFANSWDAKVGRWKEGREIPTMYEAVRAFDKEVRIVSRDRRTGLIRVAIEWHDRNKAANWANDLIARVNTASRQNAIEEANRSISYLNRELTKTGVVDVQQAIYRLIEAQINRIMVANVRQEFAFKVVDPAIAPDAKHKIRPKRLMIVMSGAFLGGLCGGVAVLLAAYRSRRKGVVGALTR